MRSGGKALLIRWAVLALPAVFMALGFHTLRHDDAFIYFRYAENLAGGNGFVFNPGERVLGLVSPGYVLLCAAMHAIAGHELLPGVMSALSCGAWTAQAAATRRILIPSLRETGALFVALCIALGAAWSHRFVALETNWAAGLLLWALVATLERRWYVAAVLWAGAFWFRMDAAVGAIPSMALAIHSLRWRIWKPGALGLVLTLPWLLWAQWYFGSPLPQPTVSKFASAGWAEYLRSALLYVSSNTLWPEIGLGELSVGRVVAAGVTALAAAWAAQELVRRYGSLWIVPATAAAYLVFYSVMRAQVGMEWHVYPALLIISIFLLALFAILAEKLTRPGHRRVLLGLVAGAIALGFALRTVHYARIHERAFWYGARHTTLVRAARYLAAHSRPGDRLTAGEVGTLAYYSNLPIIDLGRLVSPRPDSSSEPARWHVGIYRHRFGPDLRAVTRFSSGAVARGELAPSGARNFVVSIWERRR